MDSMNNLHGSLPMSSTRRNMVLAPFRETACSLTALFKTATAEIDRAYSDGARSALEQLLAAMDRENLGLQEGEGWRVRQLVMNLYEGLPTESEVPPTVSASPEPETERQSTRTSPVTSPVRHGHHNYQETSIPHMHTDSSRAIESKEDAHQQPEKSAIPSQPDTFDFKFGSVQPVSLFQGSTTPLSPSHATRTPPLRTTHLDPWNLQGLNFVRPAMAKSSVSLGPSAGSKRRSPSPADLSGASNPPTPKRVRRGTPEVR